MAVKCLMDRGAPLDRMHEMDLCRRQQLAHCPDLAERGTIEMPDAARPEGPQNAWLRVTLDGVQDIAGKAADEPTSRSGDRRRAQAQQRLTGPRTGDDCIDRGQNR